MLSLGLADSSLAEESRSPPNCSGDISVQILGSGGPDSHGDRASAGYLVWIDGKAQVLIDIGGGSFARYNASGARFEDLDLVALTHFHADHATDLPALLKSGYFTDRSRPLVISGPTGGGDFPNLEGYLSGLFSSQHGAYRYLSGYLDGSDGLVRLEQRTLDAANPQPMNVLDDGKAKVTAMGVSHGSVPALAYRVNIGDKIIVFSGDMNGDDPEFISFSRNADLLVMDYAIPESAAGSVAARLHTLPSEIGDIAKTAKVGHLLLSHIMARSEKVLDQSLEIIGKLYSGKTSVASDLMCINLENTD